MSNSYDTLVIDAGHAGLASAHYLQRAGSRFTCTVGRCGLRRNRWRYR